MLTVFFLVDVASVCFSLVEFSLFGDTNEREKLEFHNLFALSSYAGILVAALNKFLIDSPGGSESPHDSPFVSGESGGPSNLISFYFFTFNLR